MATTNTPNMSLPVPITGVEIGPNYANDINSCMSIVDSHTHTAGSGVPITPAGMNITTDLPFNNNNAISLRSVRLQNQGGVISQATDLACLYNNGGNLYFNDGSGNQIPMTAAGGIAGTPGSIANLTSPATATYTSGSKTFTWASGSSGKGAAMDSGAITIRQTDTASAKGITLSSPNALGANYGWTFPSGLPLSGTDYVSIDSSGNLGNATADSIGVAMTSTGANAIGVSMTSTGANAVAASRTRATGTSVGVGGVAISASTGVFTVSSSSFQPVTNASVTIVTSGRPVFIALIPDGTGTPSSAISITGSSVTGQIKMLRGATTIGFFEFAYTGTSTSEFPSAVTCIDAVAAGTYTYTLQASAQISAGNLSIARCALFAYEL